MRLPFWVRRSLLVFGLALVALFAVSLFKGRGVVGAAQFSVLWAAISSAVFAATLIYRTRPSASPDPDCPICVDPDERTTEDATPSHVTQP